jgi:excisionase family DNA binding protein
MDLQEQKMPKNQLLSIRAAAENLGVSEAALRQWTDEGKIQAFVTPGGHRRYSEAELERFMEASRNVLGVPDLVAEIENTRGMHPDLFRAGMTRWYDRLNGEAREQLSGLGRRMMGVVVTYISEPARREAVLRDARECGRTFGELLANLGLTLTDSVEAFIAHREPLINAATHMMSKKETLSGRVVEAIPMVVSVMDEALVALVYSYQTRNGVNKDETK